MPSFAQWDPVPLDILLDTLKVLGLKARVGKHVFDRRGYFAGRDEDRAADLNAMFADPEVKAVHCVRGGWGAARLLPFLDWNTIARNPKILVGYSDITALLLSFHAKTGLVTFHGPVGASTWNAFNLDWMKRVLWNAEAATFANAKEANDTLVPVKNRTRVITPGKARGRLLGGNLTVFTTIIGSGYLPDFRDCILFLEDVEEAPYSLDRMFTQLKLAGILGQAKGVVWGTCDKCDPGEGFGSLTIPDVLDDHVEAARGARVFGRDDWPRRPPVHPAARRPGGDGCRGRHDHHARERGRLTTAGDTHGAAVRAIIRDDPNTA